MNFSFMIYILLIIMIYIAITNKIKIPFVYFSIGALVVLILNEIYNNSMYSMKDLFYTTPAIVPQTGPTLTSDAIIGVVVESPLDPYKYDTSYNPYDYYSEYTDIKIPFYTDGQDTKSGLTCAPQKNILQNELIKQKLNLQDAYVNSLLPILEKKPIYIDDRLFDIYNPLPKDMSVNKCPTLCHLITDKRKCRDQRNIPTFTDNELLQEWINNNKACSDQNKEQCDVDTDCEYEDGTCYSKENLRKCIPFQINYNGKQIVTNLDSRYNGQEVTILQHGAEKSKIEFNNGRVMFINNENLIEDTECYTRCEYLNDNSDVRLSKLNCNSAILSNGEPYCSWDDRTGAKKCKPKCELYKDESLCNTDTGCEYDTKCVTKT